MGRGTVEAQTLRSEQFEFEARTSDPSNAQPGEYWIRADQTSSNPDTIAELRRQDTSGVTTCPIFAASEESNLGSDVVRGPSVVIDDGTVGFVAMTSGDGKVRSPRAVTASGAEYLSHNALTLATVPDSVVYDFETGDTSQWGSVNDLSAVQTRVYAGSYAGYCETAQSGKPQAREDINGYDGGSQPSEFEFFWNETSGSFGGGIRLLNSNGNVEVGLASDNQPWVIDDANGFKQVYGGDGYDRWIRFTITFDWGVGEFDADFEDLQSGSTYTDTGRPLKQATDIRTVQIDDFQTNSWQVGGAIDMWFDNIKFTT